MKVKTITKHKEKLIELILTYKKDKNISMRIPFSLYKFDLIFHFTTETHNLNEDSFKRGQFQLLTFFQELVDIDLYRCRMRQIS